MATKAGIIQIEDVKQGKSFWKVDAYWNDHLKKVDGIRIWAGMFSGRPVFNYGPAGFLLP